MSKSFYDLDYIIEINEKRLDEYNASYQKVLERLTNIILIYSALGIFLIPVVQHLLDWDIKGSIFYVLVLLFAAMFLISLYYFIRLLLPVNVAFLDPPKNTMMNTGLKWKKNTREMSKRSTIP